MKIALIAAIGKDRAIAIGDGLPWQLPDDVEDFHRKIHGHIVLMGRKTYDTIGHPLEDCPTIVITRNSAFHSEGVVIFHTIADGIEYAREQSEDTLFVLGGGEICKATLPMATDLYLTHVAAKFEEATAFFPPVDWQNWKELPTETFKFERSERNSHSFTINHYVRN